MTTLIEEIKTKVDKNNLIEYLRAVCNQEIGNIEIAIIQFTHILDRDPSFIKIPEILIKLNKGFYSIGELKYFYELILAVKPGNKNMRLFVEKHHKLHSIFNSEPNLSEIKKQPYSQSIKELKKENKYLIELVKELKINGQKYKSDNENDFEEKPRNMPAIMPDVDAESIHKQSNKFIEKFGNNFSKNNYNIKEKNVNVETLTIAKLYIKQGYYKEALDILFKLKEQDENKNRDKILETIDEVKELVQDKRSIK